MQKTIHTKLAWVVTLTASLFFFYGFIQIIFPNAIDAQLMESFNLNAIQLGGLVSMVFWGNTLFLFPAGNLLDRYSTKKLLMTAIVLCTIGTFVFALAPTASMAGSGRFVVGVSASFCFLSCIRLASRWFPPTRMAFVTGIIVTMAMLGGFVAQSPMVFLSKLYGWRHAIILDGILGVVITLAILFIVQDRPPDSKEDGSAERANLKKLGFFTCIKLVLLNPNNWLGGIYTSLLNLPVFLLGGLWGMHYLMQVHNLNDVDASYATSMLFVGVILGSPIFGYVSDHIGRRCLPMIVGAVLSLIVILILMYTPNLGLASLMTLFFLIGFVTSSQVLSYPTIAELNPTALTGTAVSIASMTIMLSGVIFDPLFGWMLEQHWDHRMVNHVAVYSAHDFNYAMLIMPVSFVVAIITAFLIRETYCELQA